LRRLDRHPGTRAKAVVAQQQGVLEATGIVGTFHVAEVMGKEVDRTRVARLLADRVFDRKVAADPFEIVDLEAKAPVVLEGRPEIEFPNV